METTDRSDLGVDLASPQTDDAGHEHHGYTLVREVQAGDLIFHYHTVDRAIVGWSRATGSFWEEDIIWASHGTVAREAGVQPYLRPGYRHGLDGPYRLADPITLGDLRHEEPTIRIAREVVSDGIAGSLYFPFALSDSRPLRPTQFYMTKFPVILTEIFPQLAEAVQTAARMPLAETAELVDEEGTTFGREYQEADEAAATSQRDPFEVDPNVVDRSLRAHAAIQNAVARHVARLGYLPLSPETADPKFDIAWVKERQAWIAEVKSLTVKNEEQQLRLGLGQVLRYRSLLRPKFDSVFAVLAVEREPSDLTWNDLCSELGVLLVWPAALDPLI
jgi:hypothetical protein